MKFFCVCVTENNLLHYPYFCFISSFEGKNQVVNILRTELLSSLQAFISFHWYYLFFFQQLVFAAEHQITDAISA